MRIRILRRGKYGTSRTVEKVTQKASKRTFVPVAIAHDATLVFKFLASSRALHSSSLTDTKPALQIVKSGSGSVH
jgi:hypothetical protein